MPRKPRSDSHKYLYRDLPKSRKQVKILIAYLEENQEGIKFWSKDTQVLIEHAKYGPPVTAKDIPETVDQEHRQPIADLLNGVLVYYLDLRQKRAEKKTQLEELRQQIPEDERARLKSFRYQFFLGADTLCRLIFTQEENEILRFTELDTLWIVNEWLNKTDDEKAEIFAALQKMLLKYAELHRLYKEKEKREQEERERWWREEQKTREHHWQYNFSQLIGIKAFDLITARLTLGVSNAANKDEIKAAWRRRVKQTHPDAGGNTQEFQKVQQAYKVLVGSL